MATGRRSRVVSVPAGVGCIPLAILSPSIGLSDFPEITSFLVVLLTFNFFSLAPVTTTTHQCLMPTPPHPFYTCFLSFPSLRFLFC